VSEKLGMQLQIEFETYSSVNAKLDSLLKRLQKANKLNIEVDTRTFERLQNEFNKLQDKISKSMKMGIDSSEVSASIESLGNDLNKLEKKQIKIVDDKQVQVIEQVRKDLIETEKIVKNLETGKTTTFLNYDNVKAQNDLYKQLNSLQRDEFNLKQNLIGKDGEIKTQLQDQLNLVRQQQTEVAKLITSYKLQDDGKINKYLLDRKILTSDLIIAQEQYNKKLSDGQQELATKIQQTQSRLQTEVQLLQQKYKDLVPSAQLQEFQNNLQKLGNVQSLKELQVEAKNLDLQLKQLSADTKAGGMNLGQKDTQSFFTQLSQDMSKFGLWYGIAGVVTSLVGELKNAVSTVIELNSAVTTINMTMDMTTNEMQELTKSSQNMSMEMGISIDETLNAVKVYANEMENVSSILEKTRADIMLATASGMSTTDTTDAIQAIMNQFELNAKGTAERIADTLEKVSANMPMD
jgi:hypothetical protein